MQFLFPVLLVFNKTSSKTLKQENREKKIQENSNHQNRLIKLNLDSCIVLPEQLFLKLSQKKVDKKKKILNKKSHNTRCKERKN